MRARLDESAGQLDSDLDLPPTQEDIEMATRIVEALQPRLARFPDMLRILVEGGKVVYGTTFETRRLRVRYFDAIYANDTKTAQ